MKAIRAYKVLLTFLLLFAAFVFAFPLAAPGSGCAFAEGGTVTVNVGQVFSSKNSSGVKIDTAFDYSVRALDSAPAANNRDFTIEGSGSRGIPFVFSADGEYSYELRQVIRERKPYYRYDENVYRITIRIESGEDPLFVIADKEGKKTEKITFLNSYEKPADPTPTPAPTSSPYPTTGDSSHPFFGLGCCIASAVIIVFLNRKIGLLKKKR